MHHGKTPSKDRNTAAFRRASAALALGLAMLLSLLMSTVLGPSVFAAAGLDENGNPVYCGKIAHKHSESCYTSVRTLICGEEETGHYHTDACYTEQRRLICGQSECPPHHHTDACFTTRKVLICTDPDHEHTDECYTTEQVLSCGLNETEGHSHTEDCYVTERVLSCGKEEREGHIHSDACYRTDLVLSCGLEEHEHTLECYSDRSAVETEAMWRASVSGAMITGRWDKDLVAVARTQIGYVPNSRNYIVLNGNKLFYTRYGDWIDNSELVVYGDWCASFASFCIYYANIRGVPYDSNCADWVKKLDDAAMYYDYGEIEPRMGDLMFIYSGREKDAETRRATHVSIVAGVTDHSIITIEGNVGTVSWCEYQLADTSQILGFARLPDNPKYRSIPGSLGRITYSGVLPDGAQALVRALSPEEVRRYDLPEGRVLFAFETSYLVDGAEKKPGVAVSVRIETGKLPEGTLHIFHIRENDKGDVTEFWPVEDLEIFDDALSYTTFTLSRCVAIVTEPGG